MRLMPAQVDRNKDKKQDKANYPGNGCRADFRFKFHILQVRYGDWV
jgi:hypothetical protein